MRPHQVMFLTSLLVAGTLLSLVLGEGWLGSSDVDYINSLTVFRDVNFFGLLSISVPNISFFAVGMVKLIQFDFAFFTGGTELVQFVLIMIFGSATLWGIFVVIIVVATNLLRR